MRCVVCHYGRSYLRRQFNVPPISPTMKATRSTRRVFVAVGVEPTASLIAVLNQLTEIGNDVRATLIEDLHITLRFIGDVKPSIVPLLADVVKDTAESFDQPTVDLTSVDAFPTIDNASVLWIKPQPDAQLIKAAATLTQNLLPFEIERDPRTFRPHATIARLRRPLRELPDATQSSISELFRSSADFGQARLTGIRMYESDLNQPQPGFAKYAVLYDPISEPTFVGR